MRFFGFCVVGLLPATGRVDAEAPAEQFQVQLLDGEDLLVLELGITK